MRELLDNGQGKRWVASWQSEATTGVESGAHRHAGGSRKAMHMWEGSGRTIQYIDEGTTGSGETGGTHPLAA